MHFEELWTANEFKAVVLRTILTPVSWLYAAGWQAYLATYRLGLKKPRHPHSPILCIGNLQVGGTGKTPATLHVADVLQDLGYSVVISCSGYGSPASEAAALAPTGPLEASEWGDEAALFRMMRPHIPLVVGRRRVLAAEICERDFPRSVMLMDDGFQHLPLEKDVTILLDPPQTNSRCLPAGPYREPKGNRSRADLVIPGGAKGFQIVPKPLTFQDSQGRARAMSGEIDVICALGRPNRFLESLRQQGLVVRTQNLLPDHDPLTDGNLLAGVKGPIVVTRKDWVKLSARPDVDRFDIVFADHEITIEPAHEFRVWLQAKLNGVATKEV